MSYLTSDERIIYKLQKYVSMLRKPYASIKDMPEHEIDECTDGWAVTQGITNIHEVVSRVDNSELYSLLTGIQKATRITRNIASHDYDAINWKTAKRVCEDIFKVVTDNFIAECLSICHKDKEDETDYTVGIFNEPVQACQPINICTSCADVLKGALYQGRKGYV